MDKTCAVYLKDIGISGGVTEVSRSCGKSVRTVRNWYISKQKKNGENDRRLFDLVVDGILYRKSIGKSL